MRVVDVQSKATKRMIYSDSMSYGELVELHEFYIQECEEAQDEERDGWAGGFIAYCDDRQDLIFQTVISELSAFFKGDKTRANSCWGNRIFAEGSIERWDGTRSGMSVFNSFEDLLYGVSSPFCNCEISAIYESDGDLYIYGLHHDGGVEVKVRQLSDAGQRIFDAATGEDGHVEVAVLKGLFENEVFAPRPRYLEIAYDIETAT